MGIIFLILFILNNVYASQYEWPSIDKSPERWINNAKENIDLLLKRKLNGNIAKNLILFLGDGMGLPTITAGRIRKGQLKKKSGEEEITYMESLGNVALSKTYNIDAQTGDSAGTATAYLCGVKTGVSIIGLNGHAIYNQCNSTFDHKVDSILKWAHKAGKSVGIVTTTRITHATPAGTYANIANRRWETFDGREFSNKQYIDGCKDIAYQLIMNNSYINVIFGGGRKKFLPWSSSDYANSDDFGERIDKNNLINKWINKMETQNLSHKFIWNATQLRNLDMKNYDHVLGLFSYDHMDYEIDRNPDEQPSIIEMTEKAIELLEKNPNGYFLLVEGGRIDHGHHESKAKKALEDFVAFDESIGKALNITSEEETLIVVTADHSHTFTIGGNSVRGNDVYGLAIKPDFKKNTSDTGLTYTSLLYGNGPGGIRQIRSINLTNQDTTDKNYIQESAVYLKSETHGGEDVVIYARGPMAHLFEGTVEQSFIPHAMAYAACIGPIYGNDQECYKKRGINKVSSSTKITTSSSFYFISFNIYIFYYTIAFFYY